MKIDLIGLINKSIDAYNDVVELFNNEGGDEEYHEAILKALKPLETIDVQAKFAAKHLEDIANKALETKDEVLLAACYNLCLMDKEVFIQGLPTPVNICKPPVKLLHSKLARYNEDSAYKSKCPFCKNGVLLLGRDKQTLALVAEDFCISCGQRIIYQDIEELRKGECFGS